MVKYYLIVEKSAVLWYNDNNGGVCPPVRYEII